MSVHDKEILNLILAKLDRIESEILEMKYPEEYRIKPEVVSRVKEAEERIEKGKGLKFKDMSKFMESVE